MAGNSQRRGGGTRARVPLSAPVGEAAKHSKAEAPLPRQKTAFTTRRTRPSRRN